MLRVVQQTSHTTARWRVLALVSLAELLGMSLWFAAAAVAPQLRAQWQLDSIQVGWLTTAVQLGFVAGTACAALLNLADLVPARAYFAVSALLGAVANAGAALIAVAYRDGPHPFERRPFTWRLAAVVARHRETRLAILGYLGHMWELYAMWTWVPAFLAASAAARAAAGHPAPSPATTDLLAFGAIACGGLGCLWGGWAAGRIGYARVVTQAMLMSGVCALGIGLLFGSSPWVLVPVAWCWGFFVVADSAQFSALVTEVA